MNLSANAEGTPSWRNLSGNAIKWIAIAAMLTDHIAWAFVPTYSVLGQIMHIIGRITGPTMCFFISEGYAHTRNVKKYLFRLGIFAVIAQIPYQLFETGRLGLRIAPCGFSVIFTLFLSLLAVVAYDRIENGALRTLAIVGLCLLSTLGDWMCFDVIFTLIFWTNRGNFRKQALNFTFAATVMVLLMTLSEIGGGGRIWGELFQFAVLLCLPILFFYSGKRGGGGRCSKWAFYIFYPVHLLIIALIAHPNLWQWSLAHLRIPA